MERRLAAILAADVQGYSHPTELNEESSTATLRSYSAVVEEVITAHRGHTLSWAGDGVVAQFPSIVEAIRCASEIQNEIAERNADLPEDQRMQFRIGVNLGDVIAEGERPASSSQHHAIRKYLALRSGQTSQPRTTARFPSRDAQAKAGAYDFAWAL